MTLDSARLVTRALVLGTPLAWAAWDAYAYARFGREATESHLIWTANLRDPYLSLGMLLAGAFLAWHFWLGPPSR